MAKLAISKRWQIQAIALLSLGLVLWGNVGCSLQTVPGLPPKEVARGQRIYEVNCALCHGERAEGALNWNKLYPDGSYPPPPHDGTGHTWHHSDETLVRMIRDGGKIYESPNDPTFKSNMPAFGDRLSDSDIKIVITYFKSLWKPDQRKWQAEVTANESLPTPAS